MQKVNGEESAGRVLSENSSRSAKSSEVRRETSLRGRLPKAEPGEVFAFYGQRCKSSFTKSQKVDLIHLEVGIIRMNRINFQQINFLEFSYLDY